MHLSFDFSLPEFGIPSLKCESCEQYGFYFTEILLDKTGLEAEK